MIFQFQTGDVTFFSEDQEYFEKRLFGLKKFLGSQAGDEDTVDVHVKIEKNKHQSGERFEGTVTMNSPQHGKFHAEVIGDNIKKCADLLEKKLKAQIKTFHQKKVKK